MFDMFMTAFSSACSLEALVANFIGVALGIVFGALCDLVLPAPFACLYTIAFTLAALLISTVVSNLLQQGFARALLSTVLAFLLVDLLQAFALLPRSGSTAIAGIMAESFIKEGTQKIVAGQQMVYGQSITDPCLSWEDSELLLEKLAAAVDTRF